MRLTGIDLCHSRDVHCARADQRLTGGVSLMCGVRRGPQISGNRQFHGAIISESVICDWGSVMSCRKYSTCFQLYEALKKESCNMGMENIKGDLSDLVFDGFG